MSEVLLDALDCDCSCLVNGNRLEFVVAALRVVCELMSLCCAHGVFVAL